ncbi:MAG: hypothetical protein WKG32_04215 [Gemmatimonadaceae bacterium]
MRNEDMNQDARRNENARERSVERPASRRSDREVPVPVKRRETPAAVHAWLDGDLPEAAVRRGDMAKDVEFWHKLNQQVDERRHMRTPAHVLDSIMAAIPQSAPTVITPWWRRPFVLTPAAATAVGAGLLAAGAAAAALFAR